VVPVRPANMILACLAAIVVAGCGGGGSAGVVIWAVGDGGSSEESSLRVADLIAADRPAHVIYLGDVYETGTAAEFDTFDEAYGSLVERMWPTPGNHDWPDHEAGYDPFWRDALGESLPYHYERRAGGWELLSANSETPQLRWLRSQTAGGGNCRIVFWHRPRFNAGRHRDEERDVARMWDAVAGHAAIVLSGHDHDLQRFKPVDGTAQHIAGAGGRGHYDVDETDPRLAFSDDSANGALRITLTPGRADLRFIATDGTVLDTSSVPCQG